MTIQAKSHVQRLGLSHFFHLVNAAVAFSGVGDMESTWDGSSLMRQKIVKLVNSSASTDVRKFAVDTNLYVRAAQGAESPSALQEGAPTVGSVTFNTGLADYRRYLFKRPLTFAVRGLHYGRYGKDAENYDRLNRLARRYNRTCRVK